MMAITVQDTGIGIPDDQINAIFSLGHRADRRRDPGDGIGLATCRIAISHHGGEIWANDTPIGASLSFTLPLWSPVEATPLHSVPRRQVTVLLADDDPVSEFAVQLEIHRLGAKIIHTARDGMEALRVYRDLDVPPDVVLADLRMPKLDGIGLAEAIRELDPTQIVILRTAHLDDRVRIRATSAGIRACVRKQDINALAPWLTGLFDQP